MPRNLGLRLCQVSFFLLGQPNWRLINARQLQQDARKLVLSRVGKGC